MALSGAAGMDERMRAWSIVALCILSAILIYVLVRTPPSVKTASAPAPAPHVQAGPVAPQPPGPVQQRPEAYQGWPFFFGWPLPEAPSGAGGKQQPEPNMPAPVPLPFEPLPSEQQ